VYDSGDSQYVRQPTEKENRQFVFYMCGSTQTTPYNTSILTRTRKDYSLARRHK